MFERKERVILKRDSWSGGMPTGFRYELTPFLWILLTLAVASLLVQTGALPAQVAGSVGDMTGRYHFLGPDDTLALLEEEGRLKGFIEVFQGEDESDEMLSYAIELGTRKGDNVEFKTSKIHEQYYRFAGVVQRGTGHTYNDPDYIRLAGNLETIAVNGVSGKEDSKSVQVVFKLKGKAELPEPR